MIEIENWSSERSKFLSFLFFWKIEIKRKKSVHTILIYQITVTSMILWSLTFSIISKFKHKKIFTKSHEMPRFANQVAIVTGGAQGIGFGNQLKKDLLGCLLFQWTQKKKKKNKLEMWKFDLQNWLASFRI